MLYELIPIIDKQMSVHHLGTCYIYRYGMDITRIIFMYYGYSMGMPPCATEMQVILYCSLVVLNLAHSSFPNHVEQRQMCACNYRYSNDFKGLKVWI